MQQNTPTYVPEIGKWQNNDFIDPSALPKHEYNHNLPYLHKKSSFTIRKDGGLDMRFRTSKWAINRSNYPNPIQNLPNTPSNSECSSLFGKKETKSVAPKQRELVRIEPRTYFIPKREECEIVAEDKHHQDAFAVKLIPNQKYQCSEEEDVFPDVSQSKFDDYLTPVYVREAVMEHIEKQK